MNFGQIRVKMFALSTIAVWCFLLPLYAQEMPVPVNVQMTLFGKILSFDRAFETDAGEEVVVGILYQSTFRPSLNVKENVERALEQSHFPAPTGARIRVLALNIAEGSNGATTVAFDEVDIVYIAPLRAIDLSSILSSTRSKKIRSLTGVPEYVDAGVAIGIGMRGERPEILINLTAAKLEGADFSSQLLKLAKVIQP